MRERRSGNNYNKASVEMESNLDFYEEASIGSPEPESATLQPVLTTESTCKLAKPHENLVQNSMGYNGCSFSSCSNVVNELVQKKERKK